MKRRLLNLLMVLSLLLFVPAVASWRPSFTYRWSYFPDPYAFLGSAALVLAAAVAWFGFDLRRHRLVAAAVSYVPSAVGLGWITVAWACNTGVNS